MKVLGALLILGTAACVATPSEQEPTQQEEKAGEVESKETESAPSCFCFGCTKYCESNGQKTQGTCC